jgi:DNA-binding response OmpR family regulator
MPDLYPQRVQSPSSAAASGAAVTPSAPRRIAVIEDEESIASAIATRLRSEGYEVEIAGDGPGGVQLCDRWRPDLVVLDLMLPGLDGIEVCKQIQRDQPMPVLMLTARDSETDLLVGLAVGADDYMTKPFSARELVARIHALLRRADRPPPGDGRRSDRHHRDRCAVAPGAVRRRAGASHADRVRSAAVPRQPAGTRLEPGRAARQGLGGYDVPSGERTVDSHIRSIRRKLGADVVRTVHGVGYAVEDGAA